VVSGGLITDPLIAERILEEGLVDMVFVGRQLIADPDWPNKVRRGQLEDIRVCCHCMDGCIGRINLNQTLWCSVNPMTGFEYRWVDEQALPKASGKKEVLIVGAGPAGLEAARICAIRGHEVSVIDRGDIIGGTAVIASVPSFKKGHKKLIEWYKTQLEKLNVRVQLNTGATPALIRQKAPDVVILATGSKPVLPDIPGIEQAVVADEVFLGKKEIGTNVVIIGGGFVGLDAALWLIKWGKKVTVVEALSEAGADITTSLVRLSFFKKPGGLLDKYDIGVITGSPVIAVRADGVETVDRLGCRTFIGADTVVSAVGRCSVLDSELRDIVEEVHVIGDAREPRKIIDAIHEGFMVALDI
jgi:2-enoate reductase